MQSTQTLIAYVVGMALAAAVLASPVACTMHRQAMVADAIRKGAHPIDAACALEGEFYRPVCLQRAAGRAQ